MTPTWSLKARLLAVLTVFCFLLTLAATTSPAEAQDDGAGTGTDCVDDRLFFDNDDDAPRIRADVASLFEQTLTLPFAEPAGRYEVLVSTFEIFSREGQEREQVVVIINGEEFGPTPDLPGEQDGVLVELNDISLGFVTVDAPIDTLVVRHAFAGEPGIGPESIRLRDVTLVCAPAEPEETTTPATTPEPATPVTTPESTPTTEPAPLEPTPTEPVPTEPATAPAGSEDQPAESVTVPIPEPSPEPTPTTEPIQIVAENTTTDTLPVRIGEQITDTPDAVTPGSITPDPSPTTTPATTPVTTGSITPETPATPAPPVEVVEANQAPTLPVTGAGSTTLSLLSLIMLVFGSGTMVASRRFAPAESKLSKAYLASLEKVFGPRE